MKITKDRRLVYQPKHPYAGNYGYVKEARLIVEASIGKYLSRRSVVHHADGNPHNNQRGNLVVCEDQGYHLLLHRRARAYLATGHANWRICRFCGCYDAPTNLRIYRRGPNKDSVAHASCMNTYMRERRERLKLTHY